MVPTLLSRCMSLCLLLLCHTFLVWRFFHVLMSFSVIRFLFRQFVTLTTVAPLSLICQKAMPWLFGHFSLMCLFVCLCMWCVFLLCFYCSLTFLFFPFRLWRLYFLRFCLGHVRPVGCPLKSIPFVGSVYFVILWAFLWSFPNVSPLGHLANCVCDTHPLRSTSHSAIKLILNYFIKQKHFLGHKAPESLALQYPYIRSQTQSPE